ncbi:rhodanese-like domain-containing protein [Hwangdonia lutea]|uniref:Rhodanese-like domain-containing protein n=1 Tax=Hwangdonia lutea TaxID=3075823 RepID=A0AA97ENZ3_9FLAO|nr:rhodanese-like domain-containing protein [Hwangdonia sp. SCSIO 19198]WOD44436.1 rhodanese-like domain-containing protein [Hwangdonia sp. SCSIO 19198]
MKKKIFYILLFFSGISFAQESLAEVLKKHNKESIPYITVENASKQQNAVILDAREFSEYKTSHLQNALFVGYDNFNLKKTIKKLKSKQQPVIVYCSIGVRSEDIAEKLKKAGYTNIYNLYGGIFEWKNSDFPVYNPEGKETDSIHTFDKAWSKWLKKGIKIYD